MPAEARTAAGAPPASEARTAADALLPLLYIELRFRVAATIAVVAGVALVPGYLNANLLAAAVLDRPPPLPAADELTFPRVTVLVAAYNEVDSIAETLTYLSTQDYPGGMEIVVIDDGSDDDTAELAERDGARDGRIRVLRVPHGGKAQRSTRGLPRRAPRSSRPSTPTRC